jgi:beta-lactamase class A
MRAKNFALSNGRVMFHDRAMSRRRFSVGSLAAASALLCTSSTAMSAQPLPLPEQLAALERQHGGRLGVSMLDTGSGRRANYRHDERFPMCSTFKLLAVACVLARVDRRQESLDRRIVFFQDAVLSYAPVTSKHVGGNGMTVAELCEAAVTLSDNTAANLLLASFGGPPGLTAYLRSIGDQVTRLDRLEPDLNEAVPGDPRDTTMPNAMVEDLRRLVVGNALSPASREQLAAWLVGCKTGDKRLRAGLPRAWRVGDKTGTGERNATNDIAVLWPPGRQPLLVAAYYVGSLEASEAREAVLAEVGRLALQL